MRKLLKSLYIKIKLLYYTVLDYFDNDVEVDVSINTVIQRQQENTKLAKGIRRLVQRLRSMSQDERVNTENLLGTDPYKKSSKEQMDALRVQDKVLKNPILKTEDDLVNSVVRKASIYELEQEVSATRKAITAALRRASKDPKDTHVQGEIKALRGKLKALRADIQRRKDV